MAAARVTTLWTLVRTALLRVLAVLGLTRPGTTRPAGAAPPAPAGPAASAARVLPAPRAALPALPARLVPAQARASIAGPLERSLPPTIKQRIHAEAHGSSPSVRRVCVTLGDGCAPPDADE